MRHEWRRISVWQFAQRQTLVCQPLFVRTPVSNFVFQFAVGNDATVFKIDQEHFARLKATFLDDFGRINFQHANFTGHDDAIVIGDVVTTRA